MASDTITNNLNEIISTKNEFKNIIRENGGEPGTVFSEYPSQIRSIISGGSMSSDTINTYISSYLDTYNYINSDSLSAYNFIDADELSAMGYVSGADVAQMGYITAADIPEVDLSSYVTKTELSNAGYITIADIPSVDLSSYVTYDYLSAQGYVTSVPAIDENIVPKETDSYTLGDSSHYYAFAYVTRISVPGIGGNIRVGANGRYFIGDGNFRPTDSNRSLGTDQYKWAATYTYNLYADNIHNFIWTGTSAEYAALDNYTSYQIYMIKEA